MYVLVISGSCTFLLYVLVCVCTSCMYYLHVLIVYTSGVKLLFVLISFTSFGY